MMTALTNVTGSHLLDNELYDFRNFEPMIKRIPAGHGSVEKELDDVFDHEAKPRIQNPNSEPDGRRRSRNNQLNLDSLS